jgi:fumarate hydratase subunit alpha
MTIVFVKIGQDVHIEGGSLEEAINEGIRRGYKEGYLRKSVVSDPLIRENTNDNTPGVIHYEIISGNQLEITIAPKGFGSENMSRIYMLKPADEADGIKKAVLETITQAGPNACPPIIVGIGIGGSFEKAALLAKKALIRDINIRSDKPHIRKLENELLFAINELNIGPSGLGGRITALGVNIETYPTHIAGLPVAINIGCHVNRHVTRIIT